jgi:hypothetical protein
VGYKLNPLAWTATSPATVYVIVHPDYEDLCKIGWAANPARRCADLSVAFPFEPPALHGSITCPNRHVAEAVECNVHHALADCRTRPNGEWFLIPPDDAMAIIDDVRKELVARLSLAA